MNETRTVFDPFEGRSVEVSNRLVDRLRGKYASGPHLPNGNPEFGWRQFQAPPIQHEAATEIERLQSRIEDLERALKPLLTTAQILLQNAEGCAVNHHGSDYREFGPPGWLADCENAIVSARAALEASNKGTDRDAG